MGASDDVLYSVIAETMDECFSAIAMIQHKIPVGKVYSYRIGS